MEDINTQQRGGGDADTLRASQSLHSLRAFHDQFPVPPLPIPVIVPAPSMDDITVEKRGGGDADTLRVSQSVPSLRAFHKKMPSKVVEDSPIQTSHGHGHGHGHGPYDPVAAKKFYLKKMTLGTCVTIFMILTVFTLFWGSLWKVPTNMHKIVGYVVDFDGGPVGNFVTSAVKQIPASPSMITWVVKDASEFPGGPQDLIDLVNDQQRWIAVSINPGASENLAAALNSPAQNTDYDGSEAITGYAEEARNENGFRVVIRPQFEAMMQPISARFANQFSAQNISSLPEAQAMRILREVPQLATKPISYQLENLHHFDISIATAMTFVGLIFLLILAFLIVLIATTACEESGYDRHLSVFKLTMLKLSTHITLYFFLSLFYSFISLWFNADFNRHFGRAGFVIYWMLHWIGMIALGFALEALMTLLTLKFLPVFLLLWILSNVAVCLLPMELLPGVFQYGYAAPFYHIGHGVRCVLFGTKNQLRLNFGVLFAWAGVSVVTSPLIIILVRWMRSRSEAKAREKALVAASDTEANEIKHIH